MPTPAPVQQQQPPQQIVQPQVPAQQEPVETPAPIIQQNNEFKKSHDEILQQKLDDLTLEREISEEANLGSKVFC